MIYSLKRLTTKKLALDGGTGVTSVDPTKLKKMDNLTVRVGLLQPDSTIPFGLASYTAGIVPVGYTSKGTSMKTGQIGTGPFMLESFDPGKQSVHTRFANYWRGGGLPYLDQVTVIDLDDDTARINALIAGQIDVMSDVPFADDEADHRPVARSCSSRTPARAGSRSTCGSTRSPSRTSASARPSG